MTQTDPAPSRRRTTVVFAVAAIALVGIGAYFVLGSDDTTHTGLRDRQAVVEARGAHVMPFDQATTTHVFEKTPNGGVEAVTINDPKDTSQVALIRMHLTHEAELFGAGDFADPAAIHGGGMPGLADLARGASRIEFTYAEAPGGATITYQTADPDLVDALHAWFDAQLADHGRHARRTRARGRGALAARHDGILGPDALIDLRARGAAMDFDATVALGRSALARVTRDDTFPSGMQLAAPDP